MSQSHRRVAALAVVGITITLGYTAPASATPPGENGLIAYRRIVNSSQGTSPIFTVRSDGTHGRQVVPPLAAQLADLFHRLSQTRPVSHSSACSPTSRTHQACRNVTARRPPRPARRALGARVPEPGHRRTEPTHQSRRAGANRATGHRQDSAFDLARERLICAPTRLARAVPYRRLSSGHLRCLRPTTLASHRIRIREHAR